jgi:hypothetical protein
MAGGQRLISWLHPCSTSNVALNTRTCTHGPLTGHPNWAGCDNIREFVVTFLLLLSLVLAQRLLPNLKQTSTAEMTILALEGIT